MPKGIYKHKHHTVETKKKIGLSNRGKVVSKETRRKLSEIGKGNTNMLGKHHSGETKHKISEALKGREKKPFSREHRNNISKALEGKKKKPFTEEHLRKLSESHLGIHLSEETKEKLRRRTISDEMRRKISEASKDRPGTMGMLGKHHSKKAKDKMGKAHKGHKVTEETRRKLREINLNMSEETKRKMSKAKIEIKLSLKHKEKISNSLKGKMPKNLNYPLLNKFKPYGHILRGTYNINGKKMFFRSKYEADYAMYLDFLAKQKQIKKWLYEKDVFIFEKIKFGTRSYRPDFKIFNNDGTIEYHEVKGYMIPQSKTQMRRFKKYYPKEFNKLRFVIYDPFSRSKENGKMVNFFLEDLEIPFDRLISYREIKSKLEVLIPGWE